MLISWRKRKEGHMARKDKGGKKIKKPKQEKIKKGTTGK